MYAPLELKAGLMEVEFRTGFNQLVRFIAQSVGYSDNFTITQTWTRNAIKNDLETCQIAQRSVGIISQKTILKNHPWVEDVEQELKDLEEENKLEEDLQPIKTKVGGEDEE